MPSDYSFRLSMYLSLALACGCLGYAEADLLPSGAVIAGLTVALLVVAFQTEGRFELGLAAANRLGVVLFVAAGFWMVSQFADRSSLLYMVPWPAGGLPYFGTLLLTAMPAKLLRPKHAGDWWALQAMGLAAVTLACALAEDEVFGILLVLYAVAAVAGLGLFYVKREAGQVRPAPRDPWLVGGMERLIGRRLDVPPAAPPAVVASAPARVRAAWRPAVGRLAVASAVALPLFFLTPRSATPRWTLGATLETGYDSPQMVDLTRTGELRVNTEGAFEVTLTDAALRPVEGLNPAQRWRGIAFGQYAAGKWQGAVYGKLIDPASLAAFDQRPEAKAVPPAFRSDMLVAVYTVRAKSTEPPVADPVRWEAGAGSPVWVADRNGRPVSGLPWLHKPDAGFATPYAAPAGRPGYVQLLYPPTDGDPDLGTGFDPPTSDPTRQVLGALGGAALLYPDPSNGAYPTGALLDLPRGLKEIQGRARQLLDELVATQKLPERVTASPYFRRFSRPAPADWELVANALRNHLIGGEYEYSLRLRRQDRLSDPVEDFLFRTRAGNCERFAAGLVLLCRAIGVPARYVLGFKGHEPLGNGRYLVRQDHAHAWVEVLVPRRAATPAGYRLHWLSVDPTPGSEDNTDPDDSLLGSAARGGRSFFQQFIVNYNSERRRQAAVGLVQAATAPAFLKGLGATLVALGLVWVGWSRRKRHRQQTVAEAPVVQWYDRLVKSLEQAGYPIRDGQTPAEYALEIGTRLSPESASLMFDLTTRYYQERFGGLPRTSDELVQIEVAVRRLVEALPPR